MLGCDKKYSFSGMDMNQKLIQTVISECHRIEEDSLYSSKSHYNVSDLWDKFNLWLGVPLAILTALSGLAAVKSYSNIVLLLSISATILTAINTSLNPSKRAALHKSAANEYNKLKNDVRIYREILLSNSDLSEKALIENLSIFSDRRNQLNSSSPNIPRWAYRRTQKDINQGFATYYVDKD